MTSVREKPRNTLIAGLLGIALIVAIVFVAATASSGLPGSTTTTVRAAFANVGTLAVGDDVRENSKRIGRVSAIDFDHGTAVATMELDGDVAVHGDARAAIWDQSALAKKFVELDLGRPEAGQLGDRTIDAGRNVNSADIDKLLNVFDPATRQAAASTLRETGGGVAGHSADLHDVLEHLPPLLGDMSTITTSLTNPQADLTTLLRNADRLATSFNGHEQQLSSLVSQLDGTLRAINVDGAQPLQDTIKDLPETLTDARSSFDALSAPLADTQHALTTVAPGARSLGAATSDLRGVLREGIAPLNRVPGVASSADPAVTSLTTTVSDARPLAPRVSGALLDAATPLQVLSPYAQVISTFFERIESMVSTESGPGLHAARVGVAIDGPAVVTGGLIPDVLLPRDGYPAPGEADREQAASPLNVIPGGTP